MLAEKIKVKIEGTVKTLNEAAVLLTGVTDMLHHFEATVAPSDQHFVVGPLTITLEQDDETN